MRARRRRRIAAVPMRLKLKLSAAAWAFVVRRWLRADWKCSQRAHLLGVAGVAAGACSPCSHPSVVAWPLLLLLLLLAPLLRCCSLLRSLPPAHIPPLSPTAT